MVFYRRNSAVCRVLFACLMALPAYGNLIIKPTFDSTITSDGNAAAIISTINAAILNYEDYFADPITVNIAFSEMGSGLGQSTTTVYQIPYSTYRSDLNTDKSTADDTTALANLPTTSNAPVGTGAIDLKSANLRAIGESGDGTITVAGLTGTFDGHIQINTTLTDIGSPGTSGLYSLSAVVEHEIDEVLGLGSNVGGTGFFAAAEAEDLFRYTSTPGVRTFQVGSGIGAYFSIDGTNDLVQFNQSGAGDYGDWASSGTPRVQDAAATPNTHPVLGVELRALDVLGYTPIVVPEPSTALLLGVALVGLGVARKLRLQ